MKRKIGNILISLGFILVLGAAGLTAYNIWDANRAAEASRHILDQMNIDKDLVEALDLDEDP